jgi:tetratricopeptide (TPR) repeat protein
MGCKCSSVVDDGSSPSESEINTNDRQPLLSNTQNRVVKQIPSSSPRKSVSHSITNAASDTSATIIEPSTTQNTLKSPSIHSEHDINENIVIIWADVNMDLSEKIYHDSMTKLQRITTSIYTCTNSEQCTNYLDSVVEKKVFLIVSDDLGEDIVPLVHDKPQLDSIYIFSHVKRQRLPWANKWSEKVKQILFNMEDIFQKIKFDSGLIDNLAPISIIHRMDTPESIENQLNQSFMYTQLLKEILLEMKYDYTSKSKLVEFCKTIYADNILQLGLIDEFEEKYNNMLAIQWYTKESFLYEMLNRDLRIQDIETIMKIGFFLRDLHQQIVEIHTEQSKTRDQDKFVVYRGQGMTPDEIEKIQANKGGLLSFNNFLSTTLDGKLSLHFAQKAHNNPNVVAILFQMEIDPKIPSVPFASVDKNSTYKYESEILFSMHTVFRIMGVQKLEERFWQVNLVLTNYNDPQLKNLVDYMRNELGEGTPLDKLGHLMLKMGEFNQAEEIYVSQLDSTDEPNWRKHFYLNHQLGYVYSEKGDYKTALSYYEKALKNELDFLPPDDPSLATTYNNIAGVHESLGDYESALSSYQKVLKIQQKTLPSTHPDFGTTYSNIGRLHQKMGDYPISLTFYQQALNVQEKFLPPKHPYLAKSHSNFGFIYSSMGDKLKALEYYKKAREIQELSLPANHPDTANTYNSIGSVYNSIEDYSNALSCFEKALEIQMQNFPENHSAFANTYNNFGLVYGSMGDKSTALSYYQKAYEICRNNPQLIQSDEAATTYNKIGSLHHLMKEHSTALSFFRKSS